jgi:hypothetical protein
VERRWWSYRPQLGAEAEAFEDRGVLAPVAARSARIARQVAPRDQHPPQRIVESIELQASSAHPDRLVEIAGREGVLGDDRGRLDRFAAEVFAAFDGPLRGPVLGQQVTAVQREGASKLVCAGARRGRPAPSGAGPGHGTLESPDVDLLGVDRQPIGVALAGDQLRRVGGERLGEHAAERRDRDVQAPRAGRRVNVRPERLLDQLAVDGDTRSHRKEPKDSPRTRLHPIQRQRLPIDLDRERPEGADLERSARSGYRRQRHAPARGDGGRRCGRRLGRAVGRHRSTSSCPWQSQAGVPPDRARQLLVLGPSRRTRFGEGRVGEQPRPGGARDSGEALNRQGVVACLGCARFGLAEDAEAARKRLDDACPEAARERGGALGGSDSNLTPGFCLTGLGDPRLHESGKERAPRITLRTNDLGGDRIAGGRALELHRADRCREAAHLREPRQADSLGDIDRVGQLSIGAGVPGEQRRDGGPDGRRRTERWIELLELARFGQCLPRLDDLTRGQQEEAADELAMLGIEARIAPRGNRLAHEPGPEHAGPVRGRDGHRIEPRRERQAFPSARGAGLRRPERRLRSPIRLDRRRPATLGTRPPRGREGQPRAVTDERCGKQLESQARAAGDLFAPVADEARHGRPVLRPAVAHERLGQGTAPLEELGRPLVAPPGLGLTDLLDQHPVEVRAQDLVVSKRPLRLVERDREQLAARELLEEERTPPPLEQLIAQVASQANEDGGVDQEPAQLVGQLGENVASEVLAQEAGARADAAEDAASLVGRLAPGRQVEQLEPGRPALRSAGEDRKLARRHRIAVEVAEEPLHLPRSEPEVVALDLEEVAGDVEARQVEIRMDARPGENPQPRRGVVDETAQRSLGRGSFQGVQVIDDERCRTAGPLLQRARRVLDIAPAGRQPGQRGPKCGLEVAQHAERIVVPGFGAIPGNRQSRRGRESRQQGCLAGAGGRDNEGEPVPLDRGRELRFEALARQCRGRRRAHLGSNHRGRPGGRQRRTVGTRVVPVHWQRRAP